MNIGIRPETLDKYLKVKKLVAEGILLKDALARYQMSPRHYHRLKHKEKAGPLVVKGVQT